jgi:hypothetical protein
MARLWERLGKLTDKEKKEYGLEEVENNEELMGRFIPILREIAITYPQKIFWLYSWGRDAGFFNPSGTG